MSQFAWVWHTLASLYYGVALRHLTRTQPTHPDLRHILLQYTRHRDAAARFLV